MRLHKISKSSSSTTDSSSNQSDSSSYGQTDDIDHDVMCLVYPDGRITTVTLQSSPS